MPELLPVAPRKSIAKLAATAIAAVAITVGIGIVGGILLDWKADRVGDLATWLSGAATFAAAALALYQAHRASVDAAEGARIAKIASSQAEWDADRQHQINVELQRREAAMDQCRQILDSLIGATCGVADAARKCAFDFDDLARRVQVGLDLKLEWVQLRPKIGVRILTIGTSRFAHLLADEALPQFDDLFNRASVLSEAKSVEEITDFIDTIDDLPSDVADRLREMAIEDFVPDLDAVIAVVEARMPSRPDFSTSAKLA